MKKNKIIKIKMFSSKTPAEVMKNPLNTSSAKYQWSFSKAARFKDPKPNCKSICYEAKSYLSKRRTSIGYGRRSEVFNGNKESVPPGAYQMNSSFEVKKNSHEKGFSFGQGRDELNFSNYLKIAENTPPPNRYGSIERDKKKGYSMRQKTQYPKNYFIYSLVEEERKKRDPGPGRYETIDQIGGRCSSSKRPNSGRISFGEKQRFEKEKKTPGPGDYGYKDIDEKGQFILSQMRGSGKRAILNEKRELKWAGNKETPGPGSYRQPSDFGYYEERTRPRTARR